MALFVNSNLALQLWSAQSISNSLAKKPWLVNSTAKLIDSTRAITEDGSHWNRDTWSRRCSSNLASLSGSLVCPSSSSPLPRYSLGVGPAIEDGFYYDTDNQAGQISNEDLPRIEEEMKKSSKKTSHLSVKKWPKTRRVKSSRTTHISWNWSKNTLEDEGSLTIYRQGEYVDLCRGPHVPSTGRIQIFHLLQRCWCILAWE